MSKATDSEYKSEWHTPTAHILLRAKPPDPPHCRRKLLAVQAPRGHTQSGHLAEQPWLARHSRAPHLQLWAARAACRRRPCQPGWAGGWRRRAGRAPHAPCSRASPTSRGHLQTPPRHSSSGHLHGDTAGAAFSITQRHISHWKGS